MRPAHLRLFAVAVVAVLLVVLVGLPWQRTASAQLPSANTLTSDLAKEIATAHESSVNHLSTFPLASGSSSYRTAVADAIDSVYFSQTNQRLTNQYGFLDFWRSQGQTLLFGYPLTGEFDENGRVVQYFERARLEFDPQSGQVQLGLIGSELLADRTFEPAEPRKNARYFAETQHNLSGKFRKFWEKRGGIGHFGLPLSEAFEENGQLVQYFERARFVYHPDDMSSFYQQQERRHGFLLATLHEVELSDLGRQVVEARGITSSPIQTMENVPEWSPSLWPRHIEVDLSTQQLRAYEGSLVVYEAPVATGRKGFNTPSGEFSVYRKVELHTMRGSMNGVTWNVPHVPWIMYINGAVAIHGTYWHNRFGTGYRPSHGCINVGMDDAEWLFNWASVGTKVIVRQ